MRVVYWGSRVTLLLPVFATQTHEPSQAIAFGNVPTVNVPRFAPSLARSFTTLPLIPSGRPDVGAVKCNSSEIITNKVSPEDLTIAGLEFDHRSVTGDPEIVAIKSDPSGGNTEIA